MNGREAKFNGEYEEMRKVTNVLYIKCSSVLILLLPEDAKTQGGGPLMQGGEGKYKNDQKHKVAHLCTNPFFQIRIIRPSVMQL